LLDAFLGKRFLKGDIAAGMMHLLILWGFLGLFAGTVLLTVDHYVLSFLEGSVYLIFSVCLEITGVMLVVGLLWAMIRRYVQRVPRLERRPGDLLVPIWLLLAALSGFLTEGVRLAAQAPSWAGWSFAGYWVSLLWSPSDPPVSLYPYFWWSHALISLGFIAAIPYSKLFHILAAPLHIYLSDQAPLLVPTEMRGDEGEAYSLRDLISFDACTRCGRCVEVCPSTGAGEPFAPRDFILWAGTHQGCFDIEKVWHCTTCRACLEVCPLYIAVPDSIHQARSTVIEDGKQVPPLLIKTLEKLFKYNNPWEGSRKNRTKWAEDLDINDFSKTKKSEGLCYFVGCTTSIETRAQGLARSFSRILQHADIPFGILGKKEPCCGDIARRVGEDALFEEQAEACLDLFAQFDAEEVVVSSPHCFHTFRNEYPALQSMTGKDEPLDLRILHYSQFLNKLLRRESLRFEKPLDLTVTYHDPCYLGRYNDIYEAPREVITSIPGVKLVEMSHNRSESLCCGGGGGRMWQEDLDADEKMSEIRASEAAATKAQVMVTACPLCLIMLEDAVKTTGLEDSLRVMDLNELVEMALDRW
jgi:Fe-S oxidoreductase/nitrate reductase gamma subunit